MKWISLLLFIFICVMGFYSTGCNTINDEQIPGDSLTAIDMHVYWQVQDESLYVRLSGPTTGWVSIGFESLPGQVMQGVNYILGYVTNDSVLHVQDNYGDGPVTHVSDVSLGGVDNIQPVKGIETNGRTQIIFKIPLNSGDIFDRILEPGNSYSVQLAYGPNGFDDYESLHEAYITVYINI